MIKFENSKKFLFLGIIATSYITGLGGYLADLTFSNISKPFQSNPGLNPIFTEDKNPKCGLTNFQKSIKNWDFSPYEKKEDGFYSLIPDTYPTYDAPEIWLEDKISTFFSEINFKAEIRGGNDLPPNLILSLGDDPKRILRFLISDNEPKVVGFEKILVTTTGDFILQRESPGRSLRFPPNPEPPLVITVNSVPTETTNQIKYKFIVSYIPLNSLNNEAVEDEFEYLVNFPDPKPQEHGGEFEKTQFGFAVYKGASIRPISFEICPLN